MGEVVTEKDDKIAGILKSFEPMLLRHATKVYGDVILAFQDMNYGLVCELYDEATRLDPEMTTIDAVTKSRVMEVKQKTDDILAKGTEQCQTN